mgnify:CR=1 FL=1
MAARILQIPTAMLFERVPIFLDNRRESSAIHL